ncbi:MAG: hypothetical protein HY700_16150 [Gemmatimonadetes bacterium]|nr:hypothetical protein [Gemmatimonadota bacterium]
MTIRMLVAAALLSAAVTGTAAAQSGHPPETSPYRDLVAKQTAQVIGGYIGGSRGAANVGPADGPLAGIRYDHAVGTPADIQIGLSVAHLKRYVVDPSRAPDARTTGPINQDLIMMEAGLSLVLMGRKTWHGFSPYVGGGLGVAFETGLGAETSLYAFGTKAILVPHVGLKWYPVQAFAIKLEARDYLWKLSYPTTFFTPPAPNVPAVLSGSAAASEWTMHPALLLSVGYTFAF